MHEATKTRQTMANRQWFFPWAAPLLFSALASGAVAGGAGELPSDHACETSPADAGPASKGECHLQTHQRTSSENKPVLIMEAGKDRSMTCDQACEKLNKHVSLLKNQKKTGTSPPEEQGPPGYDYQCWSTTGSLLQKASAKANSSTSPPEKCCEVYCVGECPCMVSEEQRCSLRSCAGCDYCGGAPEPTPAPSPGPTAGPTPAPVSPTPSPTQSPTAVPTSLPTPAPTPSCVYPTQPNNTVCLMYTGGGTKWNPGPEPPPDSGKSFYATCDCVGCAAWAGRQCSFSDCTDYTQVIGMNPSMSDTAVPGPGFQGHASGVCDIFDTNNVNGVKECSPNAFMCYGICYISHPTCPTTETLTTTPFVHPCVDGTTKCDQSDIGQCMITGTTTYSCGCAKGYECVAGCEPPFNGHTCAATTSTTSTTTTTTSCLPTQQPANTVCALQDDGQTLDLIACDCQACAAGLGEACDFKHCVDFNLELQADGTFPMPSAFLEKYCDWIKMPGAQFKVLGNERYGYCYTPPVDACNDGEPCVFPGTLDLCEQCLETPECKDDLKCCPTMKKCIVDESTSCPLPHGQCNPPCFDAECGASCSNTDYPLLWQHPTCVLR